jgi:hypothetical protein
MAAAPVTALAADAGPSAAPTEKAPSQFDSQARKGDQNLIDSQARKGDQNLSERLDRSGGVIHPPGNVDSGMHVAPPATGDKMPVVPAPGSPGGDPNVTPK